MDRLFALLPSFRDLMSRDYWRAHAYQAGYIGCGVVLFVVFLTAQFPYADALSHALAPLGLTVNTSGQSFALPFGARLENVRIVSADPTEREAPILQSESVKVAPSVLSFLILQPGIKASADLDDGVVSAVARRSGAGTRLQFNASGLNLASVRQISVISGGNLAGILSGAGNFLIVPDDSGSQSGTLALSASGVTLKVSPTLAPVRIGDMTAKATLAGNQLKVDELTSSGGDIDLNGTGVITIATTLEESTLDLKVRMTPVAGAQGRLGLLAAMLPPGGGPFQIVGTLLEPEFVGLNNSTPQFTPPSAPPSANFNAARSAAGQAFRRQQRKKPSDEDEDDDDDSDN